MADNEQTATLKIGVDSTGSQQEIAAIAAAMAKLTGAVDKLEKKSDDAGKKIGLFEKAMGSLKNAIVSVGAIFGVGLIVRGLNSLVLGTINAADNLNDLSKRLGATTEFLSVLDYVAGQSGSTIEDFAVFIKDLERKFAEFAATGSKQIGRVIAILGDDFKAAVEGGAPLEQLIFKLSARFKELSAQERIFVATTISKSGVNIIPALLEDFDKASDKLIRFGGVVSQENADIADSFNDTLDNLKKAIAGFANSLVPSILPIIEELIITIQEGIVNNRPVIINFFADILESSKEFIQAAIIGFNELKEAIGDVSNVIETIKFGLSASASIIKDLFTPSVEQLSNAILDAQRGGKSKPFNSALTEKEARERLGLPLAGPVSSGRFAIPFRSNAALNDLIKRLRIAAETEDVPEDFVGPLTPEQQAARERKRRIYGAGRSRDTTALSADDVRDAETKKKREEAQERATEQLAEYNTQLNKEVEVALLSNEEREKAIELLRVEKTIRDAGVASVETEIARIDALLIRLQQLRKIKQISDDIGQAFGDATGKIIENIDQWREALRDLFNEIRRQVINQAVVQPVKQLISSGVSAIIASFTPSTKPTGTKTIGSTGEVYQPQGNNPEFFAHGGILREPVSAVGTSGTRYSLAESKPEGVLPLARDASGNLGVIAAGESGGKAPNVQMNVYTRDANSFRRSRRQIATDLRRGLTRVS